MTEHCADCGKTIEFDKVVGQWGVRTGKSWEFCCRVSYLDDSRSRITSADYHHVAGADQRHFPKEER